MGRLVFGKTVRGNNETTVRLLLKKTMQTFNQSPNALDTAVAKQA